MATRKKSKTFTAKGERLILKIKKQNLKKPKNKQVNPFALATARGHRKKKR